MKNIVILSTQRSGSTMVCDDIAGTGVLGTPSEYLIKVIENFKLSALELKKLFEDQLKKGCTENKVCSVKVMSNQIKPIGNVLKKLGFECESPESCFYEFVKDSEIVRVHRQNKTAQAVSRVMARMTKVYHSADSIKGVESLVGGEASKESRDETSLEYDAKLISKEIAAINKEEFFLDNFIKQYSLEVIDVCYEEVIDNRSYVHELANSISIEQVSLRERRLKKVSGNTSTDWIKRYQSDHQGL